MYLEWYLKEKKAYEKTLEETVTELLSEKHLHVTTAESCTGGLISGTLVNAAGASAVLNEGYVTYSNEAKERLLGVSHETLETYGAVSEQTAKEMAEGAAKAAGAEAALSATGIAGPSGGTEDIGKSGNIWRTRSQMHSFLSRRSSYAATCWSK